MDQSEGGSSVQGDLRAAGKRRSIRVNIGDVTSIGTREARSIAKGYLSQIARGEHPKPEAARPSEPASAKPNVPGSVTLGDAWARYRDGHMVRKGRSPATIAGYRDHVERIMRSWLDKPLKELSEEPALVAARHEEISVENGRCAANGTMRTLRAIYNHAMKTNLDLPARNPVIAIDWHPEVRRDTALGTADLRPWFKDLAALDNPIRREFHLFTLLSGCRPGALKEVKPKHVHLDRRVLHIPKPKGGIKKAFDIPLSREMILCLVRAMRFSRRMHPESAADWVFAADSESGHIAEQKEERDVLSKWGNDLRQTFRTLAQTAGVSEFDARLLMNHAIPGVNAGYITRHKLLDDHLRFQQQAISRTLMAHALKARPSSRHLREWLSPGGRSALLASEQAPIDHPSRTAPKQRRRTESRTRDREPPAAPAEVGTV